jgi:large conductance mechanosensitive channel
MLKDFKAFVMRGNVVDLAVGVIIGAAFGKIVSSLVNDIIMPPIGLLLGGVDFSNKFIVLKSAVTDAAGKVTTPAVLFSYGKFINTVVEFLIVAFCVYLLIQAIGRFLPKPAPVPVTTKDCPLCAMPIPLAAVRCPHCTSALT